MLKCNRILKTDCIHLTDSNSSCKVSRKKLTQFDPIVNPQSQ